MVELRQKLKGDYMSQLMVCFFKVARESQSTFFQRDFKTDIQEVINPDEKTVERYGRPWRFSQPKISNDYLSGKLGYIASGIATKPFYDEELHDFVQQTIDTPLTNFALWTLDLSKQILAFEIQPPDIKYQSFRGAFKEFLMKRPELGFVVEDFLETSTFLAWAKEVKRVTFFKATLRLPNPNWSKVPISIQDIIKKTEADKGKIELNKSKDSTDSLNIEAEIIGDAIKYGEYGYSDIYARGEKGERTFDSRRDSPSNQTDVDKDITEADKEEIITNMLEQFIARKYENEDQ
ncbi:hypothetical protein ACFLUS_05145 [Chloroflexota bacterium]